MNPLSSCITVSGLHRGENLQPGAGNIRRLRRRFPDANIVGLAYDNEDSRGTGGAGPSQGALHFHTDQIRGQPGDPVP